MCVAAARTWEKEARPADFFDMAARPGAPGVLTTKLAMGGAGHSYTPTRCRPHAQPPVWVVLWQWPTYTVPPLFKI